MTNRPRAGAKAAQEARCRRPSRESARRGLRHAAAIAWDRRLRLLPFIGGIRNLTGARPEAFRLGRLLAMQVVGEGLA